MVSMDNDELSFFSVVPAYQGIILPALCELCVGLQPSEITSALCGVFSEYDHVRLACLNAAKCIPAVSGHYIPHEVEAHFSKSGCY